MIVLAGFLLKFPENIIAVYPNKIINIHPALLPKYGGKGMYGNHVHQALAPGGSSHQPALPVAAIHLCCTAPSEHHREPHDC